MTSRRQDAGAAVAGLFANPTATGGLAGRQDGPASGRSGRRAEPESVGNEGRARGAGARDSAHAKAGGLQLAARVRVGVELTDEQSGYLRALSRPDRTNGPRTLGTKFVATGVLVAAIELLRTVDVDMHGVAAGDGAEMAARARAALLRGGARNQEGGST
jgi:hypothetical protein